MTIVLPQLRHGDSSLVIWSLSNNSSSSSSISAKQKQPVHEFTGFTDILLDFHWRPTSKGGRLNITFDSVDNAHIADPGVVSTKNVVKCTMLLVNFLLWLRRFFCCK